MYSSIAETGCAAVFPGVALTSPLFWNCDTASGTVDVAEKRVATVTDDAAILYKAINFSLWHKEKKRILCVILNWMRYSHPVAPSRLGASIFLFIPSVFCGKVRLCWAIFNIFSKKPFFATKKLPHVSLSSSNIRILRVIPPHMPWRGALFTFAEDLNYVFPDSQKRLYHSLSGRIAHKRPLLDQ